VPHRSATRLVREGRDGPALVDREPETERIIRVYRGYDASVWARWDPKNPGNRQIELDLWQTLWPLLGRHGFLPISGCRILDVGCGSGQLIAALLGFGARPDQCVGVDLLPERIEEARRVNPTVRFICCDANHLEFPDGAFDLVVASTVFTSVLNGPDALARELARVLRPGGAIVWYDFRYNSPQNPHVRRIPKRGVQRLFPGFAIHLRTTTLLPPLARRLGRLTGTLYPLLSLIPTLRTHYAGLLIKPHD
jgi:SAM-dependent methyltransferase